MRSPTVPAEIGGNKHVRQRWCALILQPIFPFARIVNCASDKRKLPNKQNSYVLRRNRETLYDFIINFRSLLKCSNSLSNINILPFDKREEILHWVSHLKKCFFLSSRNIFHLELEILSESNFEKNKLFYFCKFLIKYLN